MTEKMTIQMVAQEAGMLKAYDSMVKALEKIDSRMDRVERSSRKSTKTAETGWQKTGKAIQGAASQLIGFQSLAGAIQVAVQGIRAEFEKINRIGKEAAERASQTGGSLRRLAANFSPDASVQDASQLAAQVRQIAKDTRTPVGVVAGAAETALSARGNADVATALDSVRQSLRLFPGEGEIANELGSRSLDLSKQAGTGDTRIGLGALIQAQQAARVTDLAKLGAAAPSATLSTVQAGGTVEQGLELFSAITNLSGDAEGRRSATAQVALESQLKNFTIPGVAGDEGTAFLTSKDAEGNPLKVPRTAFERLKAARNSQQRLAVTQSNPALAEAFLANSSFEKRSAGGIGELVRGTQQGLAELGSARQKIQPVDQGQIQNFERKISELDGLPFQSDLAATQQSASNVEGFQLSGEQSRRGRARKILSETTGQLNLPFFDTFTEQQFSAEFEADVSRGTGPEQAAISILERTRDAPLSFTGSGKQTGDSRTLINEHIKLLQQIRHGINSGGPGQKPNQPAAAINGR